jgi:hypothetical protein
MRISPLLFVAPVLVAALVSACTDDDTTATPFVADAGSDTSVAPVTCGQPGAACTGSEWCAYDLVGSCGREAHTGACRARPTSCTGECPVVCGCDGQIYCNACQAQLAGSDVDKNRGCVPPGGEVSAFALPTDPAKIVVFETDAARSLCLRLTLVHRLGTRFGLDVPAEWGVESGEITHDPADCTITVTGLPPTPQGTAVEPNGGQGSVTFASDPGQGGALPCKLSVAARFAFEPKPEYSWVPNVEVMTADNVAVGGACQ